MERWFSSSVALYYAAVPRKFGLWTQGNDKFKE